MSYRTMCSITYFMKEKIAVYTNVCFHVHRLSLEEISLEGVCIGGMA